MNTVEHTVLGGPDSFMTVRHLVVHGTNFEIGRALGSLAAERYGLNPASLAADPLYARVRRACFAEHYPIHLERVRGVAAALDLDANDDSFDLGILPYHLGPGPPAPACSVVYYPPSTTATGRGYLSRNYDFSTGTIAELMGLPLPLEVRSQMRPVMSEPYLMEWYPEDGGYASLAIQAFDVLSGVLDGINSEGLAVSIMADEEAIADLGPRLEGHPGPPKAIGLHELQVMRFLLDTCRTTDEAKEALLAVRQYYFAIPCHYIVADRSGRSFVFENSTGRNVQHVIDGGGEAQAVTNFQIHRHPEAGSAPEEPLTFETNAFWRYRTLVGRIAARKGLLTVDDIRANNACVSVQALFARMRENPAAESIAAGTRVRTLWHSLYDLNRRTAGFSFYLGEGIHADGTPTERRSGYLGFALDAAGAASHGR